MTIIFLCREGIFVNFFRIDTVHFLCFLAPKCTFKHLTKFSRPHWKGVFHNRQTPRLVAPTLKFASTSKMSRTGPRHCYCIDILDKVKMLWLALGYNSEVTKQQ